MVEQPGENQLRRRAGVNHQWREYDPFHRACTRCGLRVFMRHQGGRVRGWQTIDWQGVPGPLMLAARGEPGGACTPPPRAPIAEPVIIEYTGDPDQHPGCERVMHAQPGADRPNNNGLTRVSDLVPWCGASPRWWELGPARDWVGWNWCATCFPTRLPHHLPPSELAARRVREQEEREAKREARSQAAADKRKLSKAAKAEAAKLRFPIPPRSCPECRRPLRTTLPHEPDTLQGSRVARVARGELAGLVLLVCSRCVRK